MGIISAEVEWATKRKKKKDRRTSWLGTWLFKGCCCKTWHEWTIKNRKSKPEDLKNNKKKEHSKEVNDLCEPVEVKAKSCLPARLANNNNVIMIIPETPKMSLIGTWRHSTHEEVVLSRRGSQPCRTQKLSKNTQETHNRPYKDRKFTSRLTLRRLKTSLA